MSDETSSSPYRITSLKSYIKIRYRVRIPGGADSQGTFGVGSHGLCDWLFPRCTRT